MTNTQREWEGRFDVMPMMHRIADSKPITAADLDPTMIRNIKAFIQTEIEAAEKRERDRVDHIIRYLMDTKGFNTNEEFIACDDFAIEIIKQLSPTKDKGEDVSSNNTV